MDSVVGRTAFIHVFRWLVEPLYAVGLFGPAAFPKCNLSGESSAFPQASRIAFHYYLFRRSSLSPHSSFISTRNDRLEDLLAGVPFGASWNISNRMPEADVKLKARLFSTVNSIWMCACFYFFIHGDTFIGTNDTEGTTEITLFRWLNLNSTTKGWTCATT